MSIRILLADDHQMLREGLRAILASEGDMETVGEADEGRAAVAMARKLVPDVVIMDVGMAGLNGVEATRQIKADNPRVNVIALSMYSDKRYVVSMLEAGASGYVVKAAAFDEVRRAVRAVCAGQIYLCPEVTELAVSASREASSKVPASGTAELGPREREIVQLLSEGHTSPEIGRQLHISVSTVESHRRNIMRKLDVHSVAELTKYAIREGLTTLEKP